jgi:4-alpha-glucanotransferase
VLLHPTALPGQGGCGTFGQAAADWLALLGRHGIGVWQLLPLAPTDGTGSPYSSPSGSALNPWLLDAELLVQQGYLSAAARRLCLAPTATGSDPAAQQRRSRALGKALRLAWPLQHPSRQRAFRRWCRREAFWLRDHCRFMVLRRLHAGQPWWQWPQPLARHQRRALARFDSEQAPLLLEERLLQWQLQGQWQALRRQAHGLGVQLFGDLPFYVAHDSADVWSHPWPVFPGRWRWPGGPERSAARLLLRHRPALGHAGVPLGSPLAGWLFLVAGPAQPPAAAVRPAAPRPLPRPAGLLAGARWRQPRPERQLA